MILLDSMIVTALSLSFAAGSFILAWIQIQDARKNLRKAVLEEEQAKAALEEAQTEVERTGKLYSQNDEYIENVHLATIKINDIINKEKNTKGRINILNYGLDLETVLPWFKNTVTYLNHGDIPIKYKGLIVNPVSPTLKDVIDGNSNIQTSTVKASLEAAKSLINTSYSELSFEIRSYDDIPHFHGFIINEEHLIFGFTEVINGKLQGGAYPYLYIKKDKTSKLNQHLFEMFSTWFNYYWAKSQTQIKIEKP